MNAPANMAQVTPQVVDDLLADAEPLLRRAVGPTAAKLDYHF